MSRALFAVSAAALLTGLALSLAGAARTGGAASTPATIVSATGLCTLVALAVGLAPAAVLGLLGRPLDRLGLLLVGRPLGARRDLAWVAAGVVLFFALRPLAGGLLAGRVDLDVSVTGVGAGAGALGMVWVAQWVVARLRGEASLHPGVLTGAVATVGALGWFGPVVGVLPGLSAPLLLPVVVAGLLALSFLGAGVPRSLWLGGGVLGLVAALLGILSPVDAWPNPAGRAALALTRAAFDGDGDGFAAALGGGDCDDDDPERHPLAIEVVGDGIDQDCSGSDLAAAAPPPVTTRAGTPGGPPRQVVLVSFDALRADQLTAERMPNLLAFAAGGLTHTRAYSAAPATDLSFRATFSGWPPSDFDYRGHLVGMDRPLPLLLSDAGWQTFALHPIPDLGRLVLAGFQRVNESLAGRHLGRAGTSAAEITATALSLLRRPVDRSRLVWIHYLDPHAVYVPRPGYERFGDDLAGRYAQEVAATDAAMRPLLEHLADAEQTLTVVFADHGELLGEGGRWGHPNVLYPAVTRVPFVVRGPGIGPGRDDSPVSLLRIFPTVLGFAGIDVPARAEVGDGADVMMEGRDSSGAISTVALVRGDAMLHCDELAQVCERCDATAPLDCAPSPADPLRVALRGHLERYRNDAWYRARREVFAQWARAPSGSR